MYVYSIQIIHHTVSSILANALGEIDYTVYEEVQGLATQGSTRRIDIIAIKDISAYILDPTVRFETTVDQPFEVYREKKEIYDPTIPFDIKNTALETLRSLVY